MGQVIPACCDQRYTGTPSRHDDERGVEDRQAGQHGRGQDLRLPDPLRLCRADRDRGDQEAHREAAAIAEEDPGRPSEVVGEEAGA